MPVFVLILLGLAGSVVIFFILFSLFYVRKVKRTRLACPVPVTAVDLGYNHCYRQVEGRKLLCDSYRPPEREGQALPVVILLHGEGPDFLIKDAKDWALFRDYGRLLAQAGIVAVIGNHRAASRGLAPDFSGIEDSAADVETLVDWVRENSGDLGIDPTRMALWAFSAGGAYLGRFLAEPPAWLRCIVSFYGVLDLKSWAGAGYEAIKEYSPRYWLDQKPSHWPPLLVAVGRSDQPPLLRSTIDFVESAGEQGLPVRYEEHGSGRHGFDGMNRDERTREIIEAAVAFLQEHLEVAPDREQKTGKPGL